MRRVCGATPPSLIVGVTDMHESPRVRRLRNDLIALERLSSESSVFRFQASGTPPQQYHLIFQGRGLCRDRGKVRFTDRHCVMIKLGASYPRTIPEIRWLTPVYHPNISEIGMVCLGGYGTHWVPSVQLDELCQMLWDMIRYHNYDIRSPYNRDAALWVANQTSIRFPTDARPLRDLRIAKGRIDAANLTSGRELPGRETEACARASSPAREPAGFNPIGRLLRLIEPYRRAASLASRSIAGPPPMPPTEEHATSPRPRFGHADTPQGPDSAHESSDIHNAASSSGAETPDFHGVENRQVQLNSPLVSLRRLQPGEGEILFID
jgi:hypothetical protein